jgi:hypothetical protein
MTTNENLDTLRAKLDAANEALGAARRQLVEVQDDDEKFMDQEEVVAQAEDERQVAYDAWHAADLALNPPYDGDDI